MGNIQRIQDAQKFVKRAWQWWTIEAVKTHEKYVGNSCGAAAVNSHWSYKIRCCRSRLNFVTVFNSSKKLWQQFKHSRCSKNSTWNWVVENVICYCTDVPHLQKACIFVTAKQQACSLVQWTSSVTADQKRHSNVVFAVRNYTLFKVVPTKYL